MLSQCLHGCELVDAKECLSEMFSEERCLETDFENKEEKKKWGRKVNKNNYSTWYFWPDFEISKARCRTPCPVSLLLHH